MASRFAILFGAAVIVALTTGAALAQLENQTSDSLYSEPVLADPSPRPEHAFPPSLATSDVAAVSPAAADPAPAAAKAQISKGAARSTACTAVNPCAVASPAARG